MQYGSFQSRLNKFKLEVNINCDDVCAADRVFFLKQIFILILSSLIWSQQRLLSYNYVCLSVLLGLNRVLVLSSWALEGNEFPHTRRQWTLKMFTRYWFDTTTTLTIYANIKDHLERVLVKT